MRRVPHAIALLLLSLSLAACAGGEAVRDDGDASVAIEAPEPAEATEAAPAEPAADAALDGTAAAAEPPPAPTQAELDYAAIYGGQAYDPVADPSLPPPAELPESYDPW